MSKPTSNRKYRVLINGENFLLNMDGKIQKTGFYTTRFIEAQDAREAEVKAVEQINKDPKLSGVILNKRTDAPMLYVEEIEEVKTLGPEAGYAFYSEEEDNHEQDAV